MKISTKEGSDYFRGLLLLISKDRVITESEITIMRRVGKALGFNEEFTQEAIESILENPHVTPDPPKFSSAELAMRFLKDGLAIARSDNGIHKFEAEWLQAVASHNHVDEAWFMKEKDLASRTPKDLTLSLEADSLSIAGKP